MVNFHIFKINYKFIKIFLLMLLVSSYIFIYNSVMSHTESVIKIPIIMYHSILKSQSGTYILSPSVLEDDFKYLKDNGYNSITMSDLINYVYEDAPLPDNPIIITFDDGHYNNLTYVVPLLHKYDMKAVISIVGEYTDRYTASNEVNPNYSYLRWCDISELIKDGCIEFQNHTYNLHSTKNGRSGCKKLYNESLDEYTKFLSNDLQKLQDEFSENTGYIPNTFTYPFGMISEESVDIIKNMGFKASLSCYSGTNYISKDPNCLYTLKRNNRANNYSTYSFFNKILNY